MAKGSTNSLTSHCSVFLCWTTFCDLSLLNLSASACVCVCMSRVQQEKMGPQVFQELWEQRYDHPGGLWTSPLLLVVVQRGAGCWYPQEWQWNDFCSFICWSSSIITFGQGQMTILWSFNEKQKLISSSFLFYTYLIWFDIHFSSGNINLILAQCSL